MVSRLEPGKLYRYDGSGQRFVFMCLRAIKTYVPTIGPKDTRATVLTGLGGTGTWLMAKRCDLFVDVFFQESELTSNITAATETSQNVHQHGLYSPVPGRETGPTPQTTCSELQRPESTPTNKER